MTVHFRRRSLSRADELGALAVSILAGLGGAAAAYYLTRLYLSRETLDSPAKHPGGDEKPIGPTQQPRLPAPGGTADEGG
ncbi:MAG: hypothetical protein HKN72_11175 [Gemmatimonadetes bacterium]|nr:hypothetical protein [Gemmatimonadota bacterium]NNL29423.1 hypothetical protein [Gemmatimonadota bacterium]